VLTIFTGHEEPGKSDSPPDFRAIAATPGTKVMLMGMVRLKAIAAELEAAGMPSRTPVAVVRCATTGAQTTLAGTLADIAERAEEAGFKPPAVAIFGDVVGLRDKLNWFEKACSEAHRVTRPQAGRQVCRLHVLGADASNCPPSVSNLHVTSGSFTGLSRTRNLRLDSLYEPNGVDAFFKAFLRFIMTPVILAGSNRSHRAGHLGPRAKLTGFKSTCSRRNTLRGNHQAAAANQRGELKLLRARGRRPGSCRSSLRGWAPSLMRRRLSHGP
jgi:uroporphyrinogen III methyltransferase/synthase